MVKLIYITFFLVLVSSGCRRVKEFEKTSDTTASSDSTHIRETIEREKHKLITKADSAAIMALVPPCPDGTQANLAPVTETQGRATVTSEIKKGVLKSKCKCDTAAIQYETEKRLKEVYQKQAKQQETVIEKQVTKEVPYIPMFFKVMTVIGVAATIYGVFKLLYTFK